MGLSKFAQAVEQALAKAGKPIEAQRLEPQDDRPAIGSWWWVGPKADAEQRDDELDKDGDDDEESRKKYDRPGRKWLACVIDLGSNYVKVEGVKLEARIALDNFHKCCESAEGIDEAGIPEYRVFIDGKLDEHKNNVRELMGEIKRVCHQLGVPFRQALAEAETASQALAVAHGVEDVKRYKKALVKAKEKTLPELFEQVKEQHKHMATWMKADLIPASAELALATTVTEQIEGKIHTVELYAGLQEELVQVRHGPPADINEPVHLMQRRHYMDEECLVKYEAGGMDYKSIKDFDKWLGRDENLFRILPHKRCIIAFKIRRYLKQYGGEVDTLANFIKFHFENKQNERTFFYIRNGYQLWRMESDIDFDDELFPKREDNELLGDDDLWIRRNDDELMTGSRRHGHIESHKSLRSYCAQVLWQWHRAGKPGFRYPSDGDDEDKMTTEERVAIKNDLKTDWTYIAVDSEHEQYSSWKPGKPQKAQGDPRRFPFGLISTDYSNARGMKCGVERNFVQLAPEHIYFDDAMKRINKAAMEHNRVAVIVQGLLDRSTCLHPHPPWRIWTAEGFEQGIKLVYDVSRALTPGEAPDFEAYRKQLNKSIVVGSHTIGQRSLWRDEIGSQREYRWYPSKYDRDGEGPCTIDIVRKIRGGKCTFTFVRQRQRAKWVDHPTKKGYQKKSWDGDIEMSWSCLPDELFCVDAYTPGDFHIFFDDPRTRADYINWAPLMLASEDWHKRRRDELANPKKKKGKKDDDSDD